MYLKRFMFIAMLMAACTIQVIAQTTDAAKAHKSHFAIYAGFGPNYYLNNLEVGKQFVNEFNYSFTGRIMWEPGHLLSLGIESGYYRLYTFSKPQPNNVYIVNTAIPIQIVLSMKFVKNFYVNFSMGQAILHNNIRADGQEDATAKSISLADFSGTLGYRHLLGNKFTIGTEAKFFYSAGFVDRNVALLFVGGYRF